MEISESLLCLFTVEIKQRDDSIVIEIPDSDVRDSEMSPGDVYEIELRSRASAASSVSDGTSSTQSVQEGDVLDVEIERIGD